MFRYTPEQSDIADHITEHDGILLVNAGAGTGKSAIAKQITLELKPNKGLYTAFNKAIVEEGVNRFAGTNMECRTFHALAYKHVQPKQDISDLTYTCITENLSYKVKYEVINAINMFYVSASTDMYEYYDTYFADHPRKELMVKTAEDYTNKMIEGELNPTFNFLLKFFHLMLVEGTVKCDYDLVILDEINDTTAVALEIFKLLNAPKKLGLGESHQAIYKFLNLINGFEELKEAPQLPLTKSWRCSEEIANKIQSFMQTDLDKNFKFIGTDQPVANGKSLYCTSTNALIIQGIADRLEERKGFYLLRKPSDIFAAPLAITAAASGKQPYQKKYKFLADEYDIYVKNNDSRKSFFNHLLDTVDDDEIQNAVKLLVSFKKKNINLFDLYKRAKDAPVDPSYTIATVFTSKGLEYENVYIGDDLNNKIRNIRDNGGVQDEDDVVAYRCYYVACSRAGTNLHNALCL